MFLYYPVSTDKKLHYEFLFENGGVSVSLHFEGQYATRVDIIDEICKSSRLDIPLLSNKGKWKGCSYFLGDIRKYEKAGAMMSYLVAISLPVLKENILINTDLYLKMVNKRGAQNGKSIYYKNKI